MPYYLKGILIATIRQLTLYPLPQEMLQNFFRSVLNIEVSFNALLSYKYQFPTKNTF